MTWLRPGVSWKTYVDQLRSDDRQAVTVALAVADRALTEAKAASDEQFRVHAAELHRLESRAGGTVPREETEALFRAMGQRMEANLAAEITRLTATFTEAAQRFAAEVQVLNKTVSGLHDSMIGTQAKTSGVMSTGRVVVAALGTVLTLLLIAAAIYGFWPK